MSNRSRTDHLHCAIRVESGSYDEDQDRDRDSGSCGERDATLGRPQFSTLMGEIQIFSFDSTNKG